MLNHNMHNKIIIQCNNNTRHSLMKGLRLEGVQQMLIQFAPLTSCRSKYLQWLSWWSNILELCKIHWPNTRMATFENYISPSILTLVRVRQLNSPLQITTKYLRTKCPPNLMCPLLTTDIKMRRVWWFKFNMVGHFDPL